MDPAALMAMMGGQAKPEPWSKTVFFLLFSFLTKKFFFSEIVLIRSNRQF